MAAGVVEKFFVALMFMWIVPIIVLYGFNHSLFPGLFPVIAFYIYMAMKEPSHKHEPDPKFIADARASISQPQPIEFDSLQCRSKEE